MKDPGKSADTRAQFLLLFVVLVWAANYSVSKFSLERMDRFVFNAVRYLIAAALLSGIYFARSRWIPLDRKAWSGIIRAGFVANVLYQCAFIVGLSMTTAGNSAVFIATSPLWTVFINARLHKEPIRPNMWLGMIASLSGVVMIIVGSGIKFEFGGLEFIGDLISIAAAILWGFSTNLQKPLVREFSALYVAMLMIGVGAVGLSLIAVPFYPQVDWSSVTWPYWLAIIFSGALSIGIANVFWSYGVQRIGPGRTGNFHNLVPVIALVVSYVALREELHFLQLVGAAVTIGGVWLARR